MQQESGGQEQQDQRYCSRHEKVIVRLMFDRADPTDQRGYQSPEIQSFLAMSMFGND